MFDLPRESIPAESREFGLRDPVKAGLTGSCKPQQTQVATSSKALFLRARQPPSGSSFSAPAFISDEAGPKSSPGFGIEVVARCSAPASSAGQAVRSSTPVADFVGEVSLCAQLAAKTSGA